MFRTNTIRKFQPKTVTSRNLFRKIIYLENLMKPSIFRLSRKSAVRCIPCIDPVMLFKMLLIGYWDPPHTPYSFSFICLLS
jgi:hypothetical protein